MPNATTRAPRSRGAAPPGRAGTLAALALLVLLPLALRLLPLAHGLPRNYVPDTHVVRNALGMARDKDPIPPVGRYSSYPYLTSYLLLPAYAAQYAAGRVAGAWSGAGGFARRALEHPEDVHLVARLVVALLGAATAWVAFRAARAAGLREGAWVAAWLVATATLHVHFSVQERPWIPLALCLALAAWGAVAYAARGEPRALLACAAAGGLAFAAHQIGLFAALLVGLAWLVGPPGRAWGPAALGRRLPELALCAALFAAAGVTLGHPYLLRYGPTPEESVVGGAPGAELGGVAIGGQRLLVAFDLETAGRVLAAFFGYDPLLCVLGAAGLALALRRRELWPVAMFTLVWSLFFLVYHNGRVRYFLPIEALLALPAGLLIERLWSRTALRPLLLVALALPLVQALRLDLVLARKDTRALAEAALAQLPQGSRVAIDRYGPDVELERASLERLKDLRERRGDELRARESHRLAMLQAGAPGIEPGIDALRVEDVLGFDEQTGQVTVQPGLEHLGAEPLGALRALGATHLLLVDRRPRERHLLENAVAARDPMWVVNPGCGVAPPRECVLPMEMRFALTELWTIERPGPWMALFELP